MEKNIRLKKLNPEELTKVIDLIYNDEDLRDTFSEEKIFRTRLLYAGYVALIQKDNKNIGFVMVVNNTKTNKNEVDMGILKEYRSKGHGKEALSLLKDIIILNDVEVEIQTKQKNIAAINSIIKNGFILVREDKEHYYYSIPKEEYKNKR